MPDPIVEPHVLAAINAGDAAQQPQIDQGKKDHADNVVKIEKNAADVTVAKTDAGTAKIASYVAGAIAIIAALGTLGSQLGPYFKQTPGPIQVVNCPCAAKPAPVLIDPSLLTDDQKKAIAPTVTPKDAKKP